METTLLTPREVADELGVSVSTIRRWIGICHLPHYVISPEGARAGCVRIAAEELEAWLRAVGCTNRNDVQLQVSSALVV